MKKVFVAVFCLLVATVSAKADVVTVSPGNMNGWTFYSTDDNGTINTGTNVGQIVTGPATPPAGTGSANLVVNGDGGSAQLRLNALSGTPLNTLTSLSYSTYASVWNGQQLPWVTMWIDLDGNGAYNGLDDRLQFEPTYSQGTSPGPEQQNLWQTWDLLDLGNARWYSDKEGSSSAAGVFTIASYMASHPDAKLIGDPNQGGGIGGIRITSGLTSPGDLFNTNVDNFTIGTAGGTTTYNFEVAAVPEASPALFGVIACAVAGLVVLGRRQYAKWFA